MAEYTGIAANGVRYIIDTRYAAAPGTPEYARICEEQRRAAHRILAHFAQDSARGIPAGREEHKGGQDR